MQLTFLGATGTVTGSQYLLESGGPMDRTGWTPALMWFPLVRKQNVAALIPASRHSEATGS